ncbi:hypothetical protein LINGRAHAP2_LOCUS36922 [Linum grandiflorum]
MSLSKPSTRLRSNNLFLLFFFFFFTVHIHQNFPEAVDPARKHKRAFRVIPELRLRFIQQDTKHRVVSVLRPHHKPLPLRPHVDRETSFWRHLALTMTTPFWILVHVGVEAGRPRRPLTEEE